MSTDSPPQQQRPADNEGQVWFFSRSPRLLYFALPAAIVFAIILVFALYERLGKQTSTTSSNGTVEEEEAAEPDDKGEPTSTPEEVEEKPVPRQLLAVRRNQLGKTQSRFRQTKSRWDELNMVVGQWHHDLPKRLEGNDGRRMASDRSLVERYMTIRDLDRIPLAEVAGLKERIVTLDDALELAEVTIETDHWRFNESELMDEINAVEEGIIGAATVYEDHVLMVKVLLGQATQLQINRKSLEEVIDAIREEEKKKRVERIQQASTAAKEAGAGAMVGDANRIEQLSDDISRLESASEVRTQEAAAQAAKDKADHDEKMRKAAEEKAELARQCEQQLPAMAEYLKPFTSDGYTQPTGRTYERTTTKGPVSYNALLGAGALGNDRKSVERLYYSTVAGRNDRDLGAFPPHSFSSGHFERHYETILKVQGFLRKFGPALVEKGKLAP